MKRGEKQGKGNSQEQAWGVRSQGSHLAWPSAKPAQTARYFCTGCRVLSVTTCLPCLQWHPHAIHSVFSPLWPAPRLACALRHFASLSPQFLPRSTSRMAIPPDLPYRTTSQIKGAVGWKASFESLMCPRNAQNDCVSLPSHFFFFSLTIS